MKETFGICEVMMINMLFTAGSYDAIFCSVSHSTIIDKKSMIHFNEIFWYFNFCEMWTAALV